MSYPHSWWPHYPEHKHKGSRVKAKKITYTKDRKKTPVKKTAKKPMRSLPPLPQSLDTPTFTLVVEYDSHHDDLSGLLDSIQELMDLARGDGEVMSAHLTNVPACLDCTKLDRRY